MPPLNFILKFNILYVLFFHEIEPFKRFRGENFRNVKIRDTLVYVLSDASAMQLSYVECQCDTGRELFFCWPCRQILIEVIWEEDTMASAEIALVCGLKVR